MATKGQVDIEQAEESKTASKSRSSTSSESSSTEEEERLRRLFQTCDRDGDGYIDRWVPGQSRPKLVLVLLGSRFFRSI